MGMEQWGLEKKLLQQHFILHGRHMTLAGVESDARRQDGGILTYEQCQSPARILMDCFNYETRVAVYQCGRLLAVSSRRHQPGVYRTVRMHYFPI